MLADLQRVLLKMLAGAERKDLERESAALPPEERELLEGLDADGFRLTGLLVRKLRFERICRGDEEMEAWFDHAPESFSAAFMRYDRDVAPVEFFPRDEARAFRDYCKKRNIVNPLVPPASKEL